MLAICSDLDETPDRHVYYEIARYLNTREETSMGRGVGLEVGNTIYFDMPASQFAYWNTDDAGRAMVRDLIKSGHIDCLHSFGDLATTRGHAGRALEELARHGCKLECWIDHATAVTNFGADIMRGQGDVPGSPAYHADLTCDFGVKYVWRGRVTSIVGQDVPRSYRGLVRPDHLVSALKTAGKEFVKGALARAGNAKYEMHASNRILRQSTLRDGHDVVEFLRANPNPGGVSCGDTADGIADVLTAPVLDRLAASGGFAIFYTHLGKIKDRKVPFNARTRAGFELLAERQNDRRTLVTTTRRLLAYRRMLVGIDVSLREGTVPELVLSRAEDICDTDLSGLTLYVPGPPPSRVLLNGREIKVVVNEPDESGRRSISLPWSRLEFPR